MRPTVRFALFTVLITAATTSSGEGPKRVVLERHAELSTFYVRVDAGQQPLGAYLVDTGATYMTITQANVDALLVLGAANYVRDLEGTTVDGRVLSVPVYRLAEINLDNGCVIRDVEAAVLPGATRGLLGLSALTKTAPFVFSTNPPSLELNNCIDSPPPLASP